MHDIIENMLQKYTCHSLQDYINALKEIFQEIALLGLWRAKFYEQAAFYGGSALRILYGLNRFSEDLDFTLLAPDTTFHLGQYNHAIEQELNAFGFEVSVTKRIKNLESNIDSAFIKANTQQQLLTINVPNTLTKRIHRMHNIKIKMEIDTNPPTNFNSEAKTLLQPIPFVLKTLSMPDLFAGKMHALLCRAWQKRIKGRDWYDFIWFLGQNTPVKLTHLQARLIQSNAWPIQQTLTHNDMLTLLTTRINRIDFEHAKEDVTKFLRDPDSIALWSKQFFLDLLPRLHSI